MLGAPRSTASYRAGRVGAEMARPGPAGTVDDATLVALIREVLSASPFAGEGYRTVRARLRRAHDVQRRWQAGAPADAPGGLSAPQRSARRRAKRLHDGSIIPAAPNLRWGTDATMAWTVEDGWVWVFDLVGHFTAEASAHVAKVGDRFAALQPVYDARPGPVRRAGHRRRARPRGPPRLGQPVPQCALHRLAGLARPVRFPPAYPGEPE